VSGPTPLEAYRQALSQPGMLSDPAQAGAVVELDQVHAELVESTQESSSWFGKLFGRERAPVKGLYIHGGVGRGKTWLMDLFYATLPFNEKMRVHFYQFMERVHQDLTNFRNEEDPLELVALKLAKQARVICFDEFFVNDIGDAMILARLLEALFERNVVLVATSNSSPNELYKNGLQRAKFLPAIELLNTRCKVFELRSAQDFRLRALQKLKVYLTPNDAAAELEIDQLLQRLSPAGVVSGTILDVNGRALATQAIGADTLKVAFRELCDTARGASDYLELARRFSTLILTDVPQLDADRENAARRLISLVDTLYDNQINLVVSAQVPLEALYTGTRLTFEFARTKSRLAEMQSTHYLQRNKRNSNEQHSHPEQSQGGHIAHLKALS